MIRGTQNTIHLLEKKHGFIDIIDGREYILMSLHFSRT